MVSRSKNLKLLPDICSDSGSHEIVLLSLLLLSCACYEVDPDDIQSNEVAVSAARNVNYS